MIKALIASTFAIALTSGVALAANFGPQPASIEDDAIDYVEERLADTDGITLRAVGSPYTVMADIDGGEDDALWAIDLRMKINMGAGRTGRESMTVLFLDGEPIALTEDLDTRVTVVDGAGAQYASN